MADPYVNWAPAEVGPCTATWVVSPPNSGLTPSSPIFGPQTIVQPVGAWDFLVDGPLKDVLTASYASSDAFLTAWAAAGGEVSATAQTADGYIVYGIGARVIGVGPPPTGFPSQPLWEVSYDDAAYPALAQPIRWVVKFSVPHSIIR